MPLRPVPAVACPRPLIASPRPADMPVLGSCSLLTKSPVAAPVAVGEVVAPVSGVVVSNLAARSLAAASLPTPPYPAAGSAEAVLAPPPPIPS